MVGYLLEKMPATVRSHSLGQSDIVWVLLAVLTWRLLVALFSAPLLHEDQVFQYLEPAHRLVYGYGFIPWEYRFGIRNWLLPGFLAMLLVVLRDFGIDRPGTYIPILQCIGAVLSISSVYSAYVIGRRFHSRHAGILAAMLVGFWSELSVFATGLIPEALAMYCALGALALWSDSRLNKHAIMIGVLIGLCAVLRLQYAPVSLAILILLMHGNGWKAAAYAGAAAAFVAIGAGALDYFFWGVPFASFYNNFLFNFVYDIASTFGERTVIYYFGALALHSLMLFALAGLYGLWHWRRYYPLLLVIGAVLVPHSLIGHKEYRFIVLAIPLLLIILSCAAFEILRFPSWLPLRMKPSHVIPAAVIAASLHLAFVKGEFYREPRLDAALFLSQRSDVRAIIDLASHRWRSGGYSYLHRNIPLLFKDDLSPRMRADYSRVASHIVVLAGDPPINGFHFLAQFGPIKVLSQVSPKTRYIMPETDYRSPPNTSVDGKYVPAVSPWPRNKFRVKG